MTPKRTDLPMLESAPTQRADAPPCLVCRRRIRVGGVPLFATCTCLEYGRGVTVAALAVTGLLFLVAAVLAARPVTER